MTKYIVIITAVCSIAAFSIPQLFERFQFNTYQTYHRKQWYRLFTHGLLHADWIHLIVNMIVFVSFGQAVEYYFRELKYMQAIERPELVFVVFYVSAIIIASLTTLFKHKDKADYNSVGASGAVSAIVFASIFFNPMHKVYFFGVVPIPGIIFGVLYLAYSQYMSRKGGDNVNHDAHFVGAVYGFFFPVLLKPALFIEFFRNIF